MRGVDTNVLVRYVTRDDPDQAEIARRTIEHADAHGERLFISTVVLSELVWVFRGSLYGYDREALVEMLETLLEIPLFEIQHRAEVRAALGDYAAGTADFADHLISHLSRSAGCRDVLTFDARLSEDLGFARLDRS